MQVELELAKFYENLTQEVKAQAEVQEEGAILENVFTEIMLDYLAEAGETENARICPDIKEDKLGRRIHKINGYALSENYETLDLFITIFNSDYEVVKVPKAELDKSVNLIKRFINNALKGYYQEVEESSPIFDLAHTVFKFNKDLIRIKAFILSNGIVSSDPPKESTIGNDVLVTFNLWDLERFHRLWSSKSNREPIQINFEDDFGGSIPCLPMPSDNKEYQCYLAIIPGTILSNIYKNYGARLLEQNVRSFLQFTGKINKGIRKTILEEPHMFLAFNNGIAATAEDVELAKNPEGGFVIKSVSDFQIVNGGQTTASLFHTQRKDKVEVDNVYVQVKLTVIKDAANLEGIVSRISQYANSQNKVSTADLSSNHVFHRTFEELSRTIWAPDPTGMHNQTRWFFERARGQYRDAVNREHTPSRKRAYEAKNPRRQMFKKEDLAKYAMSWNMRPNFVARGRQKNYVEFMKNLPKQLPNKVYFEDAVAMAILFKTAEQEYGIGANAIGDIRYMVVPYTLAYLNHITDQKIDLYKIWKEQQLSEQFKKILHELMEKMNHFLKTKAPGGLISEWAKKEECWELLTEKGIRIDLEGISDYLTSEKALEERYKEQDQSIEESKKQLSIGEILSYGAKYWDGLAKWGKSSGKLSMYMTGIASNISRKIATSKMLTESEVSKGVTMLDIVRDNRIDEEKLKSLSTLKKDNIIEDHFDKFNRVKSISMDDWDRAIQIGSQTKKLDSRQISILKSVKTYLKEGKSPTPRQLLAASNALDVISKFGLKL